MAKPPPPKSTKSEYAEVGRAAAHGAQRAYLLDKLLANDWNLTATARATGLANASNVTREIKKVGLAKEYADAQKAGKVSRSSRSIGG